MGLINVPDRRIRKPIGMPQIDWDNPLSRGLVGHWGMYPYEFGGKIVHDLSGNGNGMDFVNSPVWSSGKFGPSILFDDGSSQYLQIEKAAVVAYPFTLSCWYKTNTHAAEQVLIWVGDKDVSDHWTCIFLSPADDKVNAFSHSYGGTFRNAGSSTTFTINTWEHAAGVFVSASERHIYHNGVLRGSNTGACGAMHGHDRTVIGGAGDSTPESYMSGLIDMPTIYNRALNQSEIALLYRRPF